MKKNYDISIKSVLHCSLNVRFLCPFRKKILSWLFQKDSKGDIAFLSRDQRHAYGFTGWSTDTARYFNQLCSFPNLGFLQIQISNFQWQLQFQLRRFLAPKRSCLLRHFRCVLHSRDWHCGRSKSFRRFKGSITGKKKTDKKQFSKLAHKLTHSSNILSGHP